MGREPIDDHRATAMLAAPEPDHLVRGNPDREGEQLLYFEFRPREASSIALVGIAQALAQLQGEQLSSGESGKNSEREQPINATEGREDGAFAARSRGVSEPTQGTRRWSPAARVFRNAPALAQRLLLMAREARHRG